MDFCNIICNKTRATVLERVKSTLGTALAASAATSSGVTSGDLESLPTEVLRGLLDSCQPNEGDDPSAPPSTLRSRSLAAASYAYTRDEIIQALEAHLSYSLTQSSDPREEAPRSCRREGKSKDPSVWRLRVLSSVEGGSGQIPLDAHDRDKDKAASFSWGSWGAISPSPSPLGLATDHGKSPASLEGTSSRMSYWPEASSNACDPSDPYGPVYDETSAR